MVRHNILRRLGFMPHAEACTTGPERNFMLALTVLALAQGLQPVTALIAHMLGLRLNVARLWRAGRCRALVRSLAYSSARPCSSSKRTAYASGLECPSAMPAACCCASPPTLQ